jgi:3-oxoacyl-[acyl-carrier protein] reductase
VVVTGGSRGIGLAVCRSLLDAGYRLVAVARRESRELAKLTGDPAGRVEFLAADLATADGLATACARLRSCRTLYGLVNNAGTAAAGLHATMAYRPMAEMVSLNLWAPLVLSQVAARTMARRGGRIVNVSSICAHATHRGLATYSATKAALEGLSRVLAAEVGPWGITVNCVAPGFIETAMTADLSAEVRARIRRRTVLRSQPTGESVSAVVTFLLSQGAETITAEVIRVDAGASR